MNITFKKNMPLALALSASIAIFSIASPASAQSGYPNKPIRMVVPFQAGGATDVLARLVGQKLSAQMGQPVVIDNKAGAAGIIGTDAVAKAAPDGYTVMLGLSNSLMTNQFLYTKLPYDAQKDLAMVYRIAMAPLVLVVNPSVPAKTGPELMKHIAAQKGKVSYGSYGTGAYPHLAGAHMSLTQNADMVHVAYKGEAPMVQDLLAGQIQMAFASALQVKGHLDSGKLRAIGVSGDKRMAALPKVPTLVEQGLKDEAYRVTGWLAVAAPGATPQPIIDRLASEIQKAIRSPEVNERIVGMGFEVQDNGGPAAFNAAYRQELPIWYRLIKQSGAKLD